MGEKLPEAVYRELLADTRNAIKTVKELIKSESEDIQVFAFDAFMKLSNLAATLSEALGREPKREQNPLSHNRGGGKGCTIVA